MCGGERARERERESERARERERERARERERERELAPPFSVRSVGIPVFIHLNFWSLYDIMVHNNVT